MTTIEAVCAVLDMDPGYEPHADRARKVIAACREREAVEPGLQDAPARQRDGSPRREMTDAMMTAGQHYLDERALGGSFRLPGTFNWHEFWQAIHDAAPPPDSAPASGETRVTKEPVAWVFELASQINQETREYSGWNAPQLSFTEPCVPVGSIRNLRPLYIARAAVLARHYEITEKYIGMARHWLRTGKLDEAKRHLDICVEELRALEPLPPEIDAALHPTAATKPQSEGER